MTIQDLIDKGVTLYSQRNNLYAPMRACFPTSVAMAAEALQARLSDEGEALAKWEHGRRNTGYAFEALKLDDKLFLLCNASRVVAAAAAAQPSQAMGDVILNHPDDHRNEVYYVEEYVVNTYLEGVRASIDWAVTPEDLLLNLDDLNKVVVLGTKLYAGHLICAFGRDGDNAVVGDPFGNLFENCAATWGLYPLDMPQLKGCLGLVIERV